MSSAPVRVTGIEVVEKGPDTVVTLHTADDGPRLYVLDETFSSALESALGGLRSAPAVTEAPPEHHFVQRPWNADPWLAGEAA